MSECYHDFVEKYDKFYQEDNFLFERDGFSVGYYRFVSNITASLYLELGQFF